MAVLQYPARAYVCNATDPSVNVFELGVFNIRFFQYKNADDRLQIGELYFFTPDLWDRVYEHGFLGSPTLYRFNADTNSDFEKIRRLCPASIAFDIPVDYRSYLYTLKLVFNSGRYLVSNYNFSISGDHYSFRAYESDNTEIGGTVYCPVGVMNITSNKGVGSILGILTADISNMAYPETGYLDIVGVSVRTDPQTSYTDSAAYVIDRVVANFSTTYTFFHGEEANVPIDPDTDPFTQGANQHAIAGGGTGGSWNYTGDSVSIPSLPSLSAVDAGFITLYNPTAGQLKQLAAYIWSNLFDEATFKKIFADPIDVILGLSILPVNIPNGGTRSVNVGDVSTGIYMITASSQYVEIDCGTIDVGAFTDTYLDYAPFSKAEIYLPFIGTHAISMDDIMGKSVNVVYHVDILSGACVAFVKCGDSVLYQFLGQCASSIPITGRDWTNVINGVISAAVSIGSMVATEGMTAPTAIPQLANTAVNSSKPSIEKSGAMSGAGSLLGVKKPYLILTVPRQAVPAYQNRFTGYPSFVTMHFSSLSGYTEIASVHLENIPATDTELTEIERLLKGGVIF